MKTDISVKTLKVFQYKTVSLKAYNTATLTSKTTQICLTVLGLKNESGDLNLDFSV